MSFGLKEEFERQAIGATGSETTWLEEKIAQQDKRILELETELARVCKILNSFDSEAPTFIQVKKVGDQMKILWLPEVVAVRGQGIYFYQEDDDGDGQFLIDHLRSVDIQGT